MRGYFVHGFTVCLLLTVAIGHAQEFRGSLSGRVLDQQESAISYVAIVATGKDTGAKFHTFSGSDGGYTLPFLPPGPYTVAAELAGFKRYVNGNVRVTTNEREQIDITLEIGQVDQSVTVSAEASMLETASASTGQVINTTGWTPRPWYDRR